MSATEHVKESTHGRARLSFASVADIDEFVATLEKYERGEMTPDQWRAFRLVRGTYGQRQTVDAQMLRVKVPAGHSQRRPALRAGRGRRTVLAEVRTHHHASEHPVPLREAARRRARDAPARRRGPDDARGLRQLGAQHHDVPVRRRVDRRGLRRHAVRRGDDALPAAPPAQLDAAAQVQDRVRRVCARGSHRRAPSTISASSRAGGPTGRAGFRVLAGGGTAIMCTSAGVIHEFLPASEIFRAARRCCASSSQNGDYKHKQRNRMKFMIKELGWDKWYAEYLPALEACRSEGGRAPRRSIRRRAKPRRSRPRAEAPAPTAIASRVAGGAAERPRHHAHPAAGAPGGRRGLCAVAHDERAAAEAVRLRDRRGDRAARRPHERADARARRARDAPTATAPCA